MIDFFNFLKDYKDELQVISAFIAGFIAFVNLLIIYHYSSLSNKQNLNQTVLSDLLLLLNLINHDSTQFRVKATELAQDFQQNNNDAIAEFHYQQYRALYLQLDECSDLILSISSNITFDRLSKKELKKALAIFRDIRIQISHINSFNFYIENYTHNPDAVEQQLDVSTYLFGSNEVNTIIQKIKDQLQSID